jgi:hypothetical protein
LGVLCVSITFGVRVANRSVVLWGGKVQFGECENFWVCRFRSAHGCYGMKPWALSPW